MSLDSRLPMNGGLWMATKWRAIARLILLCMDVWTNCTVSNVFDFYDRLKCFFFSSWRILESGGNENKKSFRNVLIHRSNVIANESTFERILFTWVFNNKLRYYCLDDFRTRSEGRVDSIFSLFKILVFFSSHNVNGYVWKLVRVPSRSTRGCRGCDTVPFLLLKLLWPP